uniref:Dynein regulatory complex subunit 4 n=1 Tax=Cyclopterus lumpus TaxID=8103 RepID=A0A8C3AXX8_CYCLU
QPPKSKGSSKKPAKVKTPTLIDGFTKEELSKEQMEEHIVRLREELDREKEERNYFQLERDKIHTFWEITDSKLEEVKAEKKNFDTDIEEDEGRHQVEVKVYKQKMKHLLCEHQNTISELKADGLVHTQAVQEEQNKLETVLHKDMRAVMVDMQELDNENLVKELELVLTSLKIEVQAKYEKKMELLVQELDNIMKNVTCEIEDQWNSHINTLIEDHKKAFMEVDALFIVLTFRDISDAQKEGMHTKQKEKDLVCLLQENKYLTELLSKVKEENADIERKMKYFDVIEKVKQKKLDELKCDYKTLEQKLCKVLLHLERDELEKTFTQNIQQVQDEGDWKSMQLERRLEGLIDSLEKTQAQLLSVLSASNMDQTALQGVTNKIETNLDSSNYSIKNLEYKKAQLSQARKDLLLTYEAKQRALGACGGALFKAI